MTDLQVSPRLRLGLRNGTTMSLSEKTVLPSVLFDYNVTKDVMFESELGVKYVDSTAAGVRSITKDFFVTVGLRLRSSIRKGLTAAPGFSRPAPGC